MDTKVVAAARRLATALCAGLIAGLASAAAQTPPSPSAPPAVPVSVAPVARNDVPILLRNIGTVQALQNALIRTRVDGTLEKVFFTEGQEVKKGEKLVQIDPRPYQAALDQAMARKEQDSSSLANARRDLARYQSLAQREFASRQQVDTQTALVNNLVAALHGDEASVAAAQVNLDYTTITAPFDGVMGLRQIDPGNVVRAADTTGIGIVTIAQVHPITVVFTLPQDALPAIRAGMARGKLPVQAYAPDDKTLLAEGELLTTDNPIDSATGTIKLKAVFANVQSSLWPGQFVNVHLQTDLQRGVLTVPSIAVQRGLGRLFVYVARPDHTVAVTPVTMSLDDGQTAVISSGVEDGQQVVVAGQSRLQNGARVTITPAQPAS
jgi:membrane fusion protein, multidrug efflux system